MAGRIVDADIRQLREQADIASIVERYTPLKRAGSRLKGLCPFHDEKTPSFTVAPDRGYYKCFGCGAGGDVYSLVMELEGLAFVDAVEMVARVSGFQLHYEKQSAGQVRAASERTRLAELNAKAADLYENALASDRATHVQEYMVERGITDNDRKIWRIGYAPLPWEWLTRQLITDGARPEEIVAAGLAKQGTRGIRDQFRGRLLFPVHDGSGHIVGFGGRSIPALEDDVKGPKYLNTPETSLYRKSSLLYGLTRARTTIAREGTAFICEGYTDVIAAHRVGVTSAIATCGTALTDDHVRILSRLATTIVLAFDGDAAGRKAARRSWGVIHDAIGSKPVDVRVLLFPEGSDPSDIVTSAASEEEAAEALRAHIAEAVPLTAFVLREIAATHDLTQPDAKARALREGLAALESIADVTERNGWAHGELARAVGVSPTLVGRTAQAMGIDLGRREAAVPARRAPRQTVRPRRASLERDLLRAVLAHPDLLPDTWWDLTEDDFTHEIARGIYNAIEAAGGAGSDVAAIHEVAVDPNVRAKLTELVVEEDPRDASPEHVAAIVCKMLELRYDHLIAEARAVLELLHPDDQATYDEAFRTLTSLQDQRAALKAPPAIVDITSASARS